MLSEEQVRHIAKLARVSLTDKEVERFTGQLDKVLVYVDSLSEVDVSGVEETSQVTGLKNVMRKDDVEDWMCECGGGEGESARAEKCTRDELLACSELPVDDGQIRVMRTIK